MNLAAIKPLRKNAGWLLMNFGVLTYLALMISGFFGDDGSESWLDRCFLPLWILSFLCCMSGPFLMTHHRIEKRVAIFMCLFAGYFTLIAIVATVAYFLEGFGIGI